MGNSRAVRKVADQLHQSKVEWARVYAVDGQRVDLQIGSSPSVLRDIEVVGSVDRLKPGDEVVFTRIDGRPVVLEGGSAAGASAPTVIINASGGGSSGATIEHGHTGPADGGILTDYLNEAAHAGMGLHSYSTNLPHDDHGLLLGLADDDHLNYVHLDNPRTIRAQHGFAPASIRAPFLLGPNAQGQTVLGLRADELNKSVLTEGGLTGGGLLTADRTLSLDQAYNFIWTGSHTFRALTTMRDIMPEKTDTYDLGSSTKLWRKGWLSELDAILFAQNTATLLGGWFIIGKDEGALEADLAYGDTTVDFGKAMTPNDFVVFRAALKMEYMRVGTLVGGTVYNVTRDLDGSGANDWPAGSVFLVLGQSGAGRIELNAYDTPRIQLLNQGANYNDQTERVRIGHLAGVLGLSSATNEWGLAAGTDLTDVHAPYIKVSSAGMSLSKVDITLKNGANTQTGLISAGGDLWLGKDSANRSLQHTAASGNLELGRYSAGEHGILWDAVNQTLNVRGTVAINEKSGFTTDALLYLPFDGPGPFHNNYGGSLVGHLGQTPVDLPGSHTSPIFRKGRFGKAVQFAEASNNLLINPSFEVDTYGWSLLGGGAGGTGTITRSTGYEAAYGDAVGVMTHSNAAGYTYLIAYAPAVTAGEVYTISAYINKDVAASGATISFYGQSSEAGGTNPAYYYALLNAPVDVLAGGWQRYTLQVTVPAGHTILSARFLLGGSVVSSILIDAVQVEKKSYPTPYLDGSLGVGHSWNGTPHNSTSYRAASSASYPTIGNIDRRKGSISLWVYRPYDYVGGSEQGIFDASSAWASVNQFGLFIGPGGWVQFRISNVTASNYAQLQTRNWHHLVCLWDREAGYFKSYLDGVAGPQQSYTTTPALASVITFGYLKTLNNRYINAELDDVVILDRALTDAEVQAIYETNAPINVRKGNFDLSLGGGNTGGQIVGNGDGLIGYDIAGTKQVEFLTDGKIYAANRAVVLDQSGLTTYSGSTKQVEVRTDGKIYAGAGSIKIDSGGYWQLINGQWGKLGDQIGAGYSRSTAISCPNATETLVGFTSGMVAFNNPSGAGFIPGSYDHVYIRETGVYLLSAWAQWAATAAAKPFYQLAFKVGMSTTWSSNAMVARQHFVGPGDGLQYTGSMTLTHVMHLTAGQRVFLSARVTNNGGALNLDLASLSVVKLM